MKKRIFALFLFLTFPLFTFLNVWQSYRYNKQQSEIAALERKQQEWLEQNKRIITGIEVLSSPERIENLAQNELGLRQPEPDRIIQIRIPGKGGDSGL